MKNNIKKYLSWTWIMIWFLLFVVIYYIIGNYLHQRNTVPQLCINKTCFTVEIARTEAEQESGLMNREVMAENHGMLFIFPKSDIYSFWMKNTLIPLDIMRIDDTYNIVNILTAQPCIADPCVVYNPEAIAKYVVEINAGIAAKYGISNWNVVKFQNIK